MRHQIRTRVFIVLNIPYYCRKHDAHSDCHILGEQSNISLFMWTNLGFSFWVPSWTATSLTRDTHYSILPHTLHLRGSLLLMHSPDNRRDNMKQHPSALAQSGSSLLIAHHSNGVCRRCASNTVTWVSVALAIGHNREDYIYWWRVPLRGSPEQDFYSLKSRVEYRAMWHLWWNTYTYLWFYRKNFNLPFQLL